MLLRMVAVLFHESRRLLVSFLPLSAFAFIFFSLPHSFAVLSSPACVDVCVIHPEVYPYAVPPA